MQNGLQGWLVSLEKPRQKMKPDFCFLDHSLLYKKKDDRSALYCCLNIVIPVKSMSGFYLVNLTNSMQAWPSDFSVTSYQTSLLHFTFLHFTRTW